MNLLSDVFAFLAGTPALVGPVLTALVIFLTSNWRLSLSALLVQQILVAVALTRFVSFEVALVKVLAGVLAVVILFLSTRRSHEAHDSEATEVGFHVLWFRVGWLSGPLGLPLRFLAVLLVVLVLIQLFANYQFTLLPLEISLVTCWMGGMGLAGLILSGDPLRVAAALLTILAGFDLAFSGLEPSLAVAGAFSAFVMVAALAFSYLTAAHSLSGPAAEEPEA